ncbi:MAG: alpha/beta hydrolase [Bacteroidota bacterium]
MTGRQTVVLAVSLIGCGGGCGRTNPLVVVRPHHPPAPLDPEIAPLPEAAGHWMPDPVYEGRIYVIEAGKEVPGRPPLFLVHGLGEAGVRDFYPVFAQLARTRRVVAFDLPGFGRSSRANLAYEPVGYATVLAAVIAAYANGPVDVLGHSMGGAVTLQHAGSFPQQVRRLIVVDAAGVLHREAFVGEQVNDVTGIASVLLPGLTETVRGLASAVLSEARRYEPPPRLIFQSELLRQTILRGDPERIAALGLVLNNFGPALQSIVAPALIVWGQRDTTASLRTGRLLASRLQRSRLVVLPGVGHVPMIDAPAALVALATAHLEAARPMPITWPPLPAGTAQPVTPPPSQGEGRCSGEADVRFTGAYDRIVLDHCARAILDGVSVVGQVVMHSSSVELAGATVSGGIVAMQSNVVATGGRIGGPVALDLDGSRLDLAGVLIDGGPDPIRARGDSRLLFSVCPVHTASGVVYAHGAQALPAGAAWRVPTSED